MIRRFRGLALSCAVAGLVVAVAQPASARECAAISATAWGLTKAFSASTAEWMLKSKINVWANRQKATRVSVSKTQTTCGAGPIFQCKASRRVCA